MGRMVCYKVGEQMHKIDRGLARRLYNPPDYEIRFSPIAIATIEPPLSDASGISQLERLRRSLLDVRDIRLAHGRIPIDDIDRLINEVEPMILAKVNEIKQR